MPDYPRDTRVEGQAQCPECGKWVDLIAESTGWEQQLDGSWKTDDYGPATAVHCGLLLVDDGIEPPRAYQLPAAKKKEVTA